MRVIWMGHGSFRIEIAGQVLLLDPWVTGNPSFPDERADEALDGATAILLTHGHFDHTQDCADIAKERGLQIYGMYELVNWFTAIPGVEGTGFNRGGRVQIGDVGVTLVAASHSSSVQGNGGPTYSGQECGMMIEGEGTTLYAMGDTDIMAEWTWMAELHKPDFAIVPIGGHFTMDGKRAGWGCRKYFDLKGAIPGHYRTFPLLAQSADSFVESMAEDGGKVKVLDFGGSIDV